jgi:hypothetical protein
MVASLTVANWLVLFTWAGPTLCGVLLFSLSVYLQPAISVRITDMPESADATGREPKANEWDLWQERSFIETLAIQRLNFLLVFVGLVVAGVTQTNNKYLQLFILGFGILVSGVLLVIVYRIFDKVQSLITLLGDRHVTNAVVVHWDLKNHPVTWRSSVILQGRLIPLILIIGLLIMCIVIWIGPSCT